MPQKITTYTGSARSAEPTDGGTELGGRSADLGARGLSYERILEQEGVMRDEATGLPFRWVDEASSNGVGRKRKHWVAMSAEEAQANSRPGQCWDFYVVGARCRHGCDRPMSGWTHRGRKFVPEHHHVIDVPRDEVWEMVEEAAPPLPEKEA
jgi:hypothetical protein